MRELCESALRRAQEKLRRQVRGIATDASAAAGFLVRYGLVLPCAQQDADGECVSRLPQPFIDEGDVETELARVRGVKLADREFDGDIAQLDRGRSPTHGLGTVRESLGPLAPQRRAECRLMER